VAAVLSLRGEADVVLESAVPLAASGGDEPSASAARETRLPVLAQRVGISVATLERLVAVQEAAGTEPLTTREVATRLRVQQRTARRMLHRLELAGLAERTGSLLSGGSGRPLTAYRITL
jgi:response regulator of citrate/malate metabolism